MSFFIYPSWLVQSNDLCITCIVHEEVYNQKSSLFFEKTLGSGKLFLCCNETLVRILSKQIT